MAYLSNKGGGGGGDDFNLGYFATSTALEAAYPTGADGYFAIVGSTDTFWTWDSATSAWVDTGSGGMLQADIVVDSTTSRTLAITDAGKYIRMTNAGAKTVTIPPQSSVTWDQGIIITLRNVGAGNMTLVGGVGVTIIGDDLVVLQEDTVQVVRVAADTWELIPGDSGGSSSVSVNTASVTDPDFTDTAEIEFGVVGSVVTASIANASLGLAKFSATGTKSSSTFLRGDNTWAAPSGGGGGDLLAANNLSDVTNAGTSRTNLGLGSLAVLNNLSTFDTDDLSEGVNKFTTAGNLSKLNGIETGADVTDTTNVTSAGALMDSEVTNLAQVKAFDSADYATSAQGTLADTALQSETDTLASVTGRGATTAVATTFNNTLDITGERAGGVNTITRTPVTAVNSAYGTQIIKATHDANMDDGFGVAQTYAIEDDAGVQNVIGSVQAVRDGADNTSKMQFTTYNEGTPVINQANYADGSVEFKNSVYLLEDSGTKGDYSGIGQIFVKSSDSKLYFRSDTGVETDLTTVGDVTLTGTQTLTNKRITQRVGTVASSATPTPVGNSNDMFTVTALAANATFAAPSGTPTDGQKLMIRIKDNGTARTLAWNAIYRAIGVTLPTTTVISKTLYVGCVYNSADSNWDVLAVGQQA